MGKDWELTGDWLDVDHMEGQVQKSFDGQMIFGKGDGSTLKFHAVHDLASAIECAEMLNNFIFDNLQGEQRLAVRDAVADGLCCHCGGNSIVNGNWCQCSNDE